MPNEENQGIGYVVNPEKNETITVDGVEYRRLCIKTHVITDQDNIVEVADKYASSLVQEGDILFITEKAVACTQKRAIPIDQIHPRPLARFLSRFVLRTPYGIGLAMPETMEMALRECGTIRILFAAAISAVGKLFGIRGWFYNIAGYKARSIDGPCDFTLPPYNHYVVLGPDKPDEAAADISKKVGVPVAITDINDLEGQILGTSDRSMDRNLLCKILKDNPLGQCSEQTPMGIIRRV
ncbi:F420-0--gamma-glutamyl ligase [Anaerotruncus sp. X29]|nr:F420-0--gamma-glutamyl ligase [Anaerotruncus sp. X29]